MGWISRNLALIRDLTLEHLYFALPPVVIGLVLAIPLGWLANRTKSGRSLTINVAGLLYTIPSLALFVAAAAAARHPDPRPAQRDRGADRSTPSPCSSAPSPTRWPPSRRSWSTAATAMGYTAAAPVHRGRAAAVGPGDRRRAAGRGGVEHQPRHRRRADRRSAGSAQLFTDGLPAQLPGGDRHRHRAVRALALVVDAADPAARPAAHPVGAARRSRREAPDEPRHPTWLDPAHWTGSGRHPRPARRAPRYSPLALVIALVIAVPLGAFDRAHRPRRGSWSSAWPTALRALPDAGSAHAAGAAPPASA